MKTKSKDSKIEAARKLLGDLKKRTEGGAGFLKLEMGKNVFRILPVETREGDFWITVKKHWNVGPNKEIVKCPTAVGRKCAICRAAKGETDPKAAKELKPRISYVLDVIPLHPNKSDKAEVLELGSKAFKDILKYYTDVDEFGTITDLEEGRDIVVNKNKTGKRAMDVEYEVSLRDQDKSITVDEDVLAEAPDLDTIFSEASYPSSKKVEAALEGVEYDDDDDDEDEEDVDDEKPKKKLKKHGKPRFTSKESEDEDEESESDDDEEDEPKAKKKRSKVVEEDEEEEEEDEDEEDEEPPKKSKKKSKAVDEDEDEEEEEESDEKSEKPGCFKSPEDHDPKDNVCRECDWFKPCSIAVYKKTDGDRGHPEGKLIKLKVKPKKDEDEEDEDEEKSSSIKSRLKKAAGR